MRFCDREDAGRRLAERLAAKYKGWDGVVYALPRGGVVLGREVARRLQLPLDVIIARKIGHPYNPEYAIGAVTEKGEPIVNRLEAARVQVDWLSRRVAVERHEARRQRERYVGGRAPLPATDKLAIVVDDGVATGFTMEAAIRELQGQHPAHVVVAVPVMPADIAAKFARDVDDIVVLDAPEEFPGAVGAYCEHFAQMTDDEVVEILCSINARDA